MLGRMDCDGVANSRRSRMVRTSRWILASLLTTVPLVVSSSRTEAGTLTSLDTTSNSGVMTADTTGFHEGVGKESRAESNGDLLPSSDVPWNPQTTIGASELWESVLRFPGRVSSLPLSGVGYLSRRGVEWADESYLIPRVSQWYAQAESAGVYPTTAGLGDHTGLGLTLELRPWPIRSFAGAALSASTRGYERAEVKLARGPASLEYQHDWRPADEFFGIGLRSSEAQQSDYALRSEQIRIVVAMPWDTIPRSSRPFSASAWLGPRSSTVSQGKDRSEPTIGTNFTDVPGPPLGTRVEHLTYGAKMVIDTRQGEPHLTRGFTVGFQAQRFDRPIGAMQIQSGTLGAAFTRLDFAGETGISFMREPRTVRVGVRVASVQGGDDQVLVSDLPSLGGAAGLAGFDAGRFRDRNSVVAQLTYIFPLIWRAEVETHVEAGGVYPSLGTDPKLRTLATSYGISLRPRSRNSPFARIGLDWSREGARFHFVIGGER